MQLSKHSILLRLALFGGIVCIFLFFIVACAGSTPAPPSFPTPYSCTLILGNDKEPFPCGAYRDTANNKHRDILARCSRVDRRTNTSTGQEEIVPACNPKQLPLIGMETENPTVEDLLNRVIVSHEWMGKRFEEAILALDEKAQQAILQLSRSITGVLIGSKVRPSHYVPYNSFMYIDPIYLAIDEKELATIDQAPDFRASLGDDLKFVGVWRYVTSENTYFGGRGDEKRTLGDVSLRIARLLFHELAHARDYYPDVSPLSCETVSIRCLFQINFFSSRRKLSTMFGFHNVAPRDVHDVSDDHYHLTNRNMKSYANKRYGIQNITKNEQDLLGRSDGLDIGRWMDSDVANHDYAYSTPEEDLAMLVEAVLVKYIFDTDMDVGYIDKPESGEVKASETPVTWGERGRIGNPQIKRRAERVMELALPDFVPEEFFDGLEEPKNMQTECSWLDNLDLSCSSSDDVLGNIGTVENEVPEFERPIYLDMRDPHSY